MDRLAGGTLSCFPQANAGLPNSVSARESPAPMRPWKPCRLYVSVDTVAAHGESAAPKIHRGAPGRHTQPTSHISDIRKLKLKVKRVL